MNAYHAYLKSLKEYVQKEKITFREEGNQPCLDNIWCHYSECHVLDSVAAKVSVCSLRRKLTEIADRDVDAVMGDAGCLCAESERLGFTAGLRLGAQLMLELTDE